MSFHFTLLLLTPHETGRQKNSKQLHSRNGICIATHFSLFLFVCFLVFVFVFFFLNTAIIPPFCAFWISFFVWDIHIPKSTPTPEIPARPLPTNPTLAWRRYPQRLKWSSAHWILENGENQFERCVPVVKLGRLCRHALNNCKCWLCLQVCYGRNANSCIMKVSKATWVHCSTSSTSPHFSCT